MKVLPPIISKKFSYRKIKCGSSAFTLIELLSVVAVISILMAILLPAIRYVREAARLSQATSDLRQLNSTLLLYSVGEDGNFPVDYTNIPTEIGSNYERAGHVWYEATGRILYPEIREGIEKPWMWRFHPTGYVGTVYMSPSAEEDADIHVPSYAYNNSLYDKAGSRKFQLFYEPGETVLLADCSGKSHSLTTDYPNGYINARHGASAPYASDGKAVAAYMDGHVEVLEAKRCEELNANPDDSFWGERL